MMFRNHIKAVFYLVIQQDALERAGNRLEVIFSPNLEGVFLWRQKLVRSLLQEGGALGCVQITQVGHLVAPNLKSDSGNEASALFDIRNRKLGYVHTAGLFATIRFFVMDVHIIFSMRPPSDSIMKPSLH